MIADIVNAVMVTVWLAAVGFWLANGWLIIADQRAYKVFFKHADDYWAFAVHKAKTGKANLKEHGYGSKYDTEFFAAVNATYENYKKYMSPMIRRARLLRDPYGAYPADMAYYFRGKKKPTIFQRLFKRGDSFGEEMRKIRFRLRFKMIDAF